MAALIQATLAPIVAPLVAEQAALRQTVERQAEQLVGQAETIGALTEQVGNRERELARSSAEIAALNDAAARQAAQIRRVLLAVVMVTTLAVATVLLPGWAR